MVERRFPTDEFIRKFARDGQEEITIKQSLERPRSREENCSFCGRPLTEKNVAFMECRHCHIIISKKLL